jgi:hypothetical protein
MNAMRSAVLIAVALFAAACVSQIPTASSTGTLSLEERERQLSRSIVRSDVSLRNDLLAEEFDCAFVTDDGKTIHPNRKGRRQPGTCTGFGGPASSATEWEFAADRELGGPRVAEIHSIQIEQHAGDAATVIMEQSYRNWFPGDAGMVRRARVTDKWVLRDGQWRIVHRLSQAL